ncbi:MAG: adenylate kinase [Longimicrobiaceae bacterium]
MDLVLLGPPGAGKGTQSTLLSERLGVLKVATGDMLRDAVRRGTGLGAEAKSYMDAGELVPDKVILGLIREALRQPESERGVILDGYPRNSAQAAQLSELYSELGRILDAVVAIEVPREEIVRRVSGRRSCPECGRVYNVYSDPPVADGVCDSCGGALAQRPDDREETVRRRLTVYREQTEPLIAHYRKSRVPVLEVDGDRPIEEVQEEILSRLPRASD